MLTIGDLKKAIKNISDDTPFHVYTMGTVYTVNMVLAKNVECIEHSGKKHFKSGVFVDTGEIICEDNSEEFKEL